MSDDATRLEILDLSQRLLDAIGAGDWVTYTELCSPDLTCFEPEAKGRLVMGLPFHRFYFELEPDVRRPVSTMCSPHVRLLGKDMAIVSYSRIVQLVEPDGRPSSCQFEETRVWHRTPAGWRHVHFHRSRNG